MLCVASRLEEHNLILQIGYSIEDKAGDPFHVETSQALGLHVSRAIIESHGGAIQFLHPTPECSAFEVTLPLYEPVQAGLTVNEANRNPARQLTTLIIEPDASALRKLLGGISARGHRAVPVSTAEEAVEVCHRLKFDVAFCSIRLPGMNWVDFFQKVRTEISAFVLVAERQDPELNRAFKGGDGYVLTKPIEESEVQRVIANIEERQETAPRR
jgi:CheY-like chemotaxis protein